MAVSQAMSNPSDWLSQPYPTPFFSVAQTGAPPTTTEGGSVDASGQSKTGFSLSPNRGGVAKPIRRRSRASRRTPTTLFNTNTANFRAMVQRFTGDLDAAYAAGSQLPNGGGLSFLEHISAGAGPASGFRGQYPSQEQMMFMMLGGRGGTAAALEPGSSSGIENRSYKNYGLRF